MEAKTQILIAEKKEEKSHAIRDRDDEHFHVLAVDDSVIERKMLEKLLTISSYHVTCVESGDKALEYLGLINCHGTQVLADATHVDHHHDHGEDDDDDDGDDSDDHDDDEHNNNNVGRSMIFPSLPLHDNAHHHQHGQGTRVNLIMTDYSMPGMSGYDLLKRVKESSWKDVPVVVMSSENVPSRIHMCLEEGAEEFLLKPVRMSDLEKLQPHILKSTPSTSDRKSNILAAIDNNNKIFKEETTAKISDDHDEGRNTNSKEGQDKGKSLVKIDIENFSMISKFDQL